jgi:hypothetical protein
MGDRILKVNGEDVTKSSHREAVLKLLRPGDEVVLTIQHDPLPEGYQELKIVKAEGEKLGMHIKGGLKAHRGNPLDHTDEGVFISKINSGGAAKRDGRLKVGMRLLEVNGVSLLGASHQEAVNALRNSGNEIKLVVCKGYDKSEVDRLLTEGKLSKESKSISHSVSSLDRDDEDTATLRQEQEMKQELVEWEKEEQERRDKELAVHQGQQILSLAEVAREKSTPERVLDVVRAAELLVNKPSSPTEMLVPKSPGGPKTDLKTTTIVMSKHTLAPQPSTPVSGGATLLAGASATLPRTSPNQANPPASQQYATLPKHVTIPKTEASQSCTAVKMENAQSATSQSSIPAFASALDNSVTQPVQSSASTADYAALHLQSTVINQGSYPTAVPATVHYAVQVANYGVPPLPQTAPPPPPPPASVSFPSQSHTAHFRSSFPPLPQIPPPPPPASVSFPSQSHTGQFRSSLPPLPQTPPPPPSASVSFPSQSHTGQFRSSLPPLPQTPPPPPSASVSFPSQSHTGHFPSSIHPLPQTAPPPPPNLSFHSMPDGQSHTSHFPMSFPLPDYSTYPTHSNTANEGNPRNSLPVGYSVPFSSPSPYSQCLTHQPFTTTTSTDGTVPPHSHTPHSQHSTFPLSTTTTFTDRTVPPQSQTTYSQSSMAPLSTTTAFTEIASLPQAQSLYSQYSALPPGTSTSFSDETKSPSSHSLYSQYSTLPPSITSHDEADIYSSTDDLLDPIARSRKPNARLSGKKIAVTEGVNNAEVVHKVSVSDKMKFFEKAMEEQHQPSPKQGKVFSFLSQDEVERMKQEEEKKIAALSKEELKNWTHVGEAEQDDDDDGENHTKKSSAMPLSSGLLSMGSVRTAKAERRMKDRLQQEGLLSDEEDEKELSPAEQRTLRAEKRAAWRQARLKSLEQDALQAQMVIKKMSEMIDAKPGSQEARTDAVLSNNNGVITDKENNIEVETLKEKIISLELSNPESEKEGESEINGGEEEEGEGDPPASPVSPTPSEEPLGGTIGSKKRRRKRSKRGKH